MVVLALLFYSKLKLKELWIGFGSGKSYKELSIHEMYTQLGAAKSNVLPLFPAISGNDTTSQMFGIGKKTAWAAWEMYLEVTTTLKKLMKKPNLFTIDSEHMAHLERWIVLMFSKGCGAAHVNEARMHVVFVH